MGGGYMKVVFCMKSKTYLIDKIMFNKYSPDWILIIVWLIMFFIYSSNGIINNPIILIFYKEQRIHKGLSGHFWIDFFSRKNDLDTRQILCWNDEWNRSIYWPALVLAFSGGGGGPVVGDDVVLAQGAGALLKIRNYIKFNYYYIHIHIILVL